MMLLIAATLAAVLHVLMDVCTSAGIALLWPWRMTRFGWDWLPGVDPGILALLLAGLLLPEMFWLVGSGASAQRKGPPGGNGAISALGHALIYLRVAAAAPGRAA